jgi:hypothetical protein
MSSLSLSIPELNKKLKEPLEKKIKSLLQEFFDATNKILIPNSRDLKSEVLEVKKREKRLSFQKEFANKLFVEISNTESDISIFKNSILRKMFPKKYSSLSSEKLESIHLRELVLNLLSSPRTKEQLLFSFDDFVDAGEYDAVFYMGEYLQRSYQPIQPGQKEKYSPQFIREIEEKIQAVKEELGILQTESEIEATEKFLKVVLGLYNYLTNQALDLLVSFDKLSTETLDLINDASPEFYQQIYLNKYPHIPRGSLS